jgi:hypothetical protein
VPAILAGVAFFVVKEPLPDTVNIWEKAGVPEQSACCGSKRLKMIVPVGWKPPDTVPVSLRTTVPAEPPALGVVLRDGAAVATDTVSSPQDVEAPLLLASPLYVAVQLQVPVVLAGVGLVVVAESSVTGTVCVNAGVPEQLACCGS